MADELADLKRRLDKLEGVVLHLLAVEQDQLGQRLQQVREDTHRAYIRTEAARLGEVR